jgi:hypothetical protein
MIELGRIDLTLDVELQLGVVTRLVRRDRSW